MNENAYAQPKVMVSTGSVGRHGAEPGIRLIESNEDVLLYDTEHIESSI
jgi:thiosulfate/3-mercaptopyruvate sulfurtransferase